MKQKLLIALLYLSCLLFPLSACSSSLSGAITEDGSLNVQPLAEKLSAAFTNKNPQVTISIKGSSTNAGIQALASGSVDIAGASRDLKSGDPPLMAHLIANDGIAFIVHPSNPITNLTLEHIRGILSGQIANWRQVGGLDQAIHIISREEGTSTRSVIEEMVMGGAQFSSDIIVRLNNEEQKQTVLNDPLALGYNPFAMTLDSSVKTLCIEGAAATKENAQNNTYPIIRPLYLLTKGEPQGLVKAFIDFCLGAEGQQLVASLGYVPIK